MPGEEHLGACLHVATVVTPVAVYFLILGLLNSRRHPQLLTGRQDFTLLIAAMSPLVVMPVLQYFGPSARALATAAGATAAAVLLLAPRGATWVIYNISLADARDAVAESLRDMGVRAVPADGRFILPDHAASVQVGGLSLLRNVSVRLRGGAKALARDFDGAISRRLSGSPAETSPMAAAFLLVATAMLVAPLALAAQRAPEIVRIITDLLY